MDRCIWCNIILTPTLADPFNSNFCVVCNRHMDVAFMLMEELDTSDADVIERAVNEREVGICRMFA